MSDTFPMAHFVEQGKPVEETDLFGLDDELETPPDVLLMLGFDPLDVLYDVDADESEEDVLPKD